jgi:hypothetical protein
MTTDRASRRWLPGAAFVVLAGSWYGANLLAASASLRTLHAADARLVAAGHEPMFTGLPSAWGWQHDLTPMLLGLVGAAIVAVLARRASSGPWFLLAGALPAVLGRSDHLHGWWAPGAGIDHWTYGADVGIPGRLDLSHFGAGPAWALAAGTLLAVAVVVVPATFVRPSPALHRQHVVQALPYIGLLSVGAAVVTGALQVDASGNGSSSEMLVAAAATAVIAAFAAWVAPEGRLGRHTVTAALGVGLVAVSGFHPAAMVSTKAAAFGAAAGIALAAAGLARRGRVTTRLPAPEPEPLPQP